MSTPKLFKLLSFKSIQFIKSAAKKEQWASLKSPQGNPLPEIAILGRSNVGKSTLLNHLGIKKIAKVSSTPGKTQLINFFLIDQQAAWVDLPGYGYAAVGKAKRNEWGEMVDIYLKERESLSLFIFLLDCRRSPNNDDRALFDWLLQRNIPQLIVLTKFDKLNQREKKQQRELIASELELDKHQIPLIPYSALKNMGKEALILKINELLYQQSLAPTLEEK